VSAVNVLLISDSHGNAARLTQIVERTACDHVIHCGDFCTEVSELPAVSRTVVQGNCDYEVMPEEETWEAVGFRFFVTHGHRYRVKASPLTIRYRGEELGVQVVCFGHSHMPYCEQSAGILLLNPGSIVQPRGFTVPTYVQLTLHPRQIDVRFYQVNGELVPQLGGRYHF
jgi:uncharacterized protein